MQKRISLNGSDWQLKSFLGEDWRWRKAYHPETRDRRCWLKATVPGSVQNDLWQQGEIPDPYFERNSELIEWVPQRAWIYKKFFPIPNDLHGKRVFLHFEGVDYSAQFYLNGNLLGEHSGMYTPAVFDVGEQLHRGEENHVAVVIDTAPVEQPQVGRSSKVRTHKSRMGYWWDFCPRMINVGIWDDVYLKASGPAKLEDVWVHPSLSGDFLHAEVEISTEISVLEEIEVELEAVIWFEGQEVACGHLTSILKPGTSSLQTSLPVWSPELWWPNGYGDQSLYQVEVKVFTADEGESDSRDLKIGIRKVEFAANEDADANARPYTLVVNGKRIYVKGWNWVPMDALYGVERPEKLDRLLKLACEANVNMLRVWGGGLIEKEAFYERCDRLGILVWQEFIQSSSGIDNRPAEEPAFVEWMVSEAESIIPRRRNHPSLAIWCGGNELQSLDGHPLEDASRDSEYCHILLESLRSTVERLDPDRLWLPTSPTGPVFGNDLENIARDPQSLHDVHGPWEHQGLGKHNELYNQGCSLLHSEFGVEGITNRKTLDRTISKKRQVPVTLDNPIWYHLGAWWVKEAVWREIFRELPDIDTAVRALQFLQADGLRYAVEADRRRKWHNSGTLPWQFNEPYPMAACTSAVDYYAQPKPAYYAVKEAYAPVHVSAKFASQSLFEKNQFEAEVWVSSSLNENLRNVDLQVDLMGVSGDLFHSEMTTLPVHGNASNWMRRLSIPLDRIATEIFFLDLSLVSCEGRQLSHNRYIFTKAPDLYELLHQPETSISTTAHKDGYCWEIEVANTGGTTAMFAWLEDGRDNVSPGYAYFDSNYFCLFPGEQRLVNVEWDAVPNNKRKLQVTGWNFTEIKIE